MVGAPFVEADDRYVEPRRVKLTHMAWPVLAKWVSAWALGLGPIC